MQYDYDNLGLNILVVTKLFILFSNFVSFLSVTEHRLCYNLFTLSMSSSLTNEKVEVIV